MNINATLEPGLHHVEGTNEDRQQLLLERHKLYLLGCASLSAHELAAAEALTVTEQTQTDGLAPVVNISEARRNTLIMEAMML